MVLGGRHWTIFSIIRDQPARALRFGNTRFVAPALLRTSVSLYILSRAVTVSCGSYLMPASPRLGTVRRMSRLPKHTERHTVGRIGWLRAAVLGANDGIVSTGSMPARQPPRRNPRIRPPLEAVPYVA